MKNSTEKNQTDYHQNELEGALAGMEQNRWRSSSTSDASDGPGPLVLALAFAATTFIVMGVALSLVS